MMIMTSEAFKDETPAMSFAMEQRGELGITVSLHCMHSSWGRQWQSHHGIYQESPAELRP